MVWFLVGSHVESQSQVFIEVSPEIEIWESRMLPV